MMAPPPSDDDCTTLGSLTYEIECTVIGNPETSGQYDCITVPVLTTYLICSTGTTVTTTGGGSSGTASGPTGGGSGGGSWPPPPPPPILPCKQGAAAALMANNMLSAPSVASKISSYRNGLANTALEKGFSIVKVGDAYAAQGEQTGSASSVGIIATDPNIVIAGGFHTHTSAVDGFPSPGDMYALLIGNGKNSSFKHYFTLSSSGLYDFVIADATKAAAFLRNYPIGTHVSGISDVAAFGYDSPLYWDYKEASYTMSEIPGLSTEDINAYAYACIFNKFDAGVALLKADASGQMQPVLFQESRDANGKSTYGIINCGGTSVSAAE
ncbi:MULTISPECIES: hypothetical protein [Chitinophagaceae]